MPRLSQTRPVLLGLLALIAAPAHAMPLSSLEILQQFNLVVFDDLTSSSHVHGRAFIGGNATSSSRAEFGEDATTPKSNLVGTTVLGDISNFTVNNGGLTVGGSASNGIVNGGASRVLGNVSNVIFNGGRVGAVADPRLSGFASSLYGTDFRRVLSDESNALKSLSANSKTVRQGNVLVFNAKPNADGVAVFTVDSLAGISEFSFNIGSDARTVLINCGIASGDLNINFLAGSAQSQGRKLLWNFYAASALNISAQWGGTLLATDALLTNTADVEGTLVADRVAINGEIHQNPFTGELPPVSQVPEPASLALLGVGLLGLIGVGRRKG